MFFDQFKSDNLRDRSPSLRNPPLESRFIQDLERERSSRSVLLHDYEESRRYLEQKEKEKQLIEASKRLGESLLRAKEEEERMKRAKAS
jgi:hypothetical protein